MILVRRLAREEYIGFRFWLGGVGILRLDSCEHAVIAAPTQAVANETVSSISFKLSTTCICITLDLNI